MKHLRDISIRWKLVLLTMVASGLGLLLASAAMRFFRMREEHNRKERDLAATAEMLRVNSTAALSFDDARAAGEILEALTAKRHIRGAALYGPDGRLLATYVRKDLNGRIKFPRVPQRGFAWARDTLSYADPAEFEGKPAGVIFLEADLEDLRLEARSFLLTNLGTVCVCLLIVYFLARRLQKNVSAPIEALSETARQVAGGKNYSLRAPQFGKDELGGLSRDFNHMLDEIEKRNAALREARDNLERRVAERTRELHAEVAVRRRAEQALHERTAFLDTLIQSSPIAIVVVDAFGRIELANPAFRHLFGFDPHECALHELDKLIAPEGRSEETARISGQVLAGRSIQKTAIRRRKDGTLVDVEIFGVPLIVDGVLRGQLALYHDITKPVHAQKALEQAKEAAEAANRAKSEFLANMSHEIRTPMNGILGMVELSLDTQLTGEQREFMEMAKSSAESLLNIIDDILDFSKVEAGRLELENARFSLAECIEEALKPLVVRAQQKGIELAWEMDAALPDLVRGDATRLRQVLVNLAGNGVKFTEQGQVAIHVKVVEESESALQLQFTVSDTGIGIPADKHRSIFEAFSQGDMSTTKTYGGTGLGLSISARLVALMGGRIWLESEVGQGSRFHFAVSLHKADVETEPLRPASVSGRLAGKRVLVVDDNPVNRRLLELLLRRWEMIPTLAVSWMEGLKLFLKSKKHDQLFSVVLLDMRMPGMDGFRLAEELRKISSPEPPVILLLSSAPQSADRARCEQLRIVRTLVKPIRRAALREALEVALGEVTAQCLPRASASSPGAVPPLKILLAEDNPVNQRLAFRLLEKMGHQVWLARNGREVLDMVSVKQFDLLLMDIQMPLMGGIEATQRARAAERGTGRRIPIVAMTAHALSGDREKCLDAGMDGYVTKPIRADTLCKELQRAMARKEKKMPEKDGSALGAADESAVNPAELAARVEGDRGLLRDLIGIFREDYPKHLGALREAIVSGNARAAASSSHALKGMLSNLAGKKASAIAAALEQSARQGELEKVRQELPELEQEIARLAASLEELCAEIHS